MKPTSTRGTTVAIAVAVGLVTGVGAFVLHRSFSSATPPWSDNGLQMNESPAPAYAPQSSLEAPLVGAGAAGRDPHAEALRHPSEVFRNTSLTSVIRSAGYVCTSIVSAQAGSDDLGAWRVSCEDARAYLVSEDAAGDLSVEPIPFFELPVLRPMNVLPDSPGITLPRPMIPPE